MDNDELTKLKIDYIKRNIEYWVSELIKKQDTLLFHEDRLTLLSKMKNLSEDEQKIRDKEKPADIKAVKYEIEKAEVHIKNLQKLLVSYTDKRSAK